ncbi:MAG: hypothetical protein MUF03_12235 [Rubrivivax sp.]|jgi:polar amino acid transport system substrate-binding protein|nr:hypothetical protein [Rubrivivax sp.]
MSRTLPPGLRRAFGARARCCALAVAITGTAAAQAAAGPSTASAVVTLHYQDRPPYSAPGAGGVPRGLVADAARSAVEAAGLAVAWSLTPSQRQLALIQQGQGLHCGIGWYRNAEREALGKYSRPLYRDQPLGALARNDAGLVEGMPVGDALSGHAASLLLKEGYSYGPVLDAAIAALPAAPRRTAAEMTQIARMLAAGRAGWTIVAPEEAQELLARADTPVSALRNIRLSQVPSGPTRHLYCNRAVPDDWLSRFDSALAPLR